MSTTIIAEKPSLAMQIAAALPGVKSRSNGYLSVGDVNITWLFGHMFQLAEPEAYDPRWGRPWRLEALPITEPTDGWILKPREDAGVKAQLKVITSLLKSTKVVVHAGDPDREGQLLVDELLTYYKWAGPTKRMLIYDTSKAGCAKAWANLEPNSEYAALYAAALCRTQADFLVGLNFTRAASLKIGGSTISVGRVQTPTLGLVHRRDKAISAHTETAFYTLKATADLPDASLELIHADASQRILEKQVADGLAKSLQGSIVELACREEPFQEHAPLPFTLTSYQKEAEIRLGWKGKKSMEALQRAYEGGLVSYPRTACPYLPREQAKQALRIAEGILQGGKAGQQAKDLFPHMQPSDRVYDDAKVDAHFGLVPTATNPGPDVADEALKAWVLVSERFLASLLPNYHAVEKVISFTHQERVFKIIGEAPINAAESWRVFAPKLGRDKLPVKPLQTRLKGGDTARARISKVDVSKGKTTPPKPYTEAELKEDMEGIHRFVDNPTIKAVLKENAGLGTVATRNAIIDLLKLRKYVEEEKKGKTTYLRITKLGRYVIESIPAVLSDPVVTALWEQQLEAIEKRNVEPAVFMSNIAAYVSANVEKLATSSYAPMT